MREMLPIYTGKVIEFDFNGNTIFKIVNNQYFMKNECKFIPLRYFNEPVNLYSLNGEYIFGIQTYQGYVYVKFKKVDVIESKLLSFDGFEQNKEYILSNGQIWKQITNLTSNCISSGYVKILDNTIKVDNWNFYPRVKRVK